MPGLGSANVGHELAKDAGGGSDSSPPWLVTARARAKFLTGGVLGGEWFTDFLDTSAISTTIGATGTLTSSAALDGGVAVLASGTTGGSTITVHPAGKPAFVSDVATRKMYARWRLRFEGPTGAQCILRVGIVKPDLTSFIGWGVMGATVVPTGSNAFFCKDIFTGAVETATPTTIALESALYHDVEEVLDGAGNFAIYFDGALASSGLTSAAGPTFPGMPFARAFTNDTTNRLLDIDKMYAAFALGQ